ncbi:MAG: homoserine dehydrogenase [Oscillospiraceae bacterium]|jgi:homoserine dehydrogenase|nr:homoserine dehydrogenase [Oscillospiraceae bacterium]
MNVAVMGYGIVGSGVAEVLAKKHDSIAKRSLQEDLSLKYILDIRDFPDDPNAGKFIKDFNVILQDNSVQIVVETIGGLHPAYDYVLACLQAGKSVVTSNKELVAEKGDELLATAKEHNVNFLFEASVGGGIPIIRPISQCLAANELDEIAGILNGTTNYILTQMITSGLDFDTALKQAQELGYAEKDPTADVDGHDACRKICILAALCFGTHVCPKEVHTEGIRALTLADVGYARSWGGVIKLLARAKRLDDGQIAAIVSPALVKNSSQLAGVNDVFNAILVRGDTLGDVVFYGRGAGKLPTASAVVADVVDCARNWGKNRMLLWDNAKDAYVRDYLDYETAFLVRAKSVDVPAAYADADRVFGTVQRLIRDGASDSEFAFVTPADTERALRAKLDTLLGVKVLSIIRVADY